MKDWLSAGLAMVALLPLVLGIMFLATDLLPSLYRLEVGVCCLVIAGAFLLMAFCLRISAKSADRQAIEKWLNAPLKESGRQGM
jgi:hypothetical protein